MCVGQEAANFLGRLAREMLRLTDFRTSVYVDGLSSWYEVKTGREVRGQCVPVHSQVVQQQCRSVALIVALTRPHFQCPAFGHDRARARLRALACDLLLLIMLIVFVSSRLLSFARSHRR